MDNFTVTKGNPLPLISNPGKADIGTPFTLGVQITTGAGTIVPTGTVQFFDGASPPTPLGGPVTLSGGQASTQAVINTGGAHFISVQYSGDNTYNAKMEGFVDIQVGRPFSFSAAATSQTIAAGGTATYSLMLNVSPDFPGFSGVISFTCAGAPSGSTCIVNPNPLNVSGTVTSMPFTMTVTNTANAHLGPGLQLVFAGLVFVGLVGIGRSRRRIFCLLATFLIAGLVSCGGGGGNGGGGGTNPRSPTNATLTITGTDAPFDPQGQTNSITLSLTITH